MNDANTARSGRWFLIGLLVIVLGIPAVIGVLFLVSNSSDDGRTFRSATEVASNGDCDLVQPVPIDQLQALVGNAVTCTRGGKVATVAWFASRADRDQYEKIGEQLAGAGAQVDTVEFGADWVVICNDDPTMCRTFADAVGD